MDALRIDGAWVYTPQVHHDDRGSFAEAFRGAEFTEALGYRFEIAQANCSVSRRGVIRGIHFSDVPPGQAKFVTCASGSVLDVVVDLRAGSPTFGEWEAVQLDGARRNAIFLSEGLGHAFMALTDDATVMYLCSTPYAPGREHGVNPLDPKIGIEWPLDGLDPVLSEKDRSAISLEQALSDGILPRHDACSAYVSTLRSA